MSLTDKAKELEGKVREQDDYEFMVRCANDEDEDGMSYLGKRFGVELTPDDSWSLIEVYQTKGSAY
jgi:hypothetical protein